MAILISCKCGKTLKARDELAGKKVKCPGCGNPLPVPKAEDEQPVATPKAAGLPRGKRAAAKKPSALFWIHPTFFDNVVAVTDEALYVADLDKEELEPARLALEEGQPVRKVLHKKGKVIPLDDVKKLESNLHTNRLDVTWQSPDSGKESETTVFCASKEVRDEIIAALRDKLGEDWEEKTVKYSWLRAAALPAYTGGILLFLCFCLYMVATGHDTGGSGGGSGLLDLKGLIFFLLMTVFGATGTLILMGLITVLAFVWLYFRVKTPPIMWTLKPRG